jgi:hypothetical protein
LQRATGRRPTYETGSNGCTTRGSVGGFDSEWQSKGATLSDKSARRQFGLTQAEIVEAIRAGKLHYRVNSVYGNPFLRLLRREVERLVKRKRGRTYLKSQQIKTELANVDQELRRLKVRMAALEARGSQLTTDLASLT